MDIMDIFDEVDPPKKPMARSIAETLGDDDEPRPSQEMLHEAVRVAELHDRAISIDADYEASKSALLKEMNDRLAPLLKRKQVADKASKDAKSKLQKKMEASGVDYIELGDRRPIYIKTTPGKKTGITLTWLKTHIGDEREAKRLWEAQPKKPASKDLIVPSPTQDEPTR